MKQNIILLLLVSFIHSDIVYSQQNSNEYKNLISKISDKNILTGKVTDAKTGHGIGRRQHFYSRY
jgi:hypothetical protein